MRVFLLGAGASKAYDQSPTGQRMPVARDFFETFHKLAISQNLWVLIEGLMGYLETEKKVGSALEYLISGVDIEALHSEIEEARDRHLAQSGSVLDAFHTLRAFNELVFLFASVINEIQNGPVSTVHQTLADSLATGDAVITFNWDTLLDRALAERTAWRPDWGYGALPNQVFENGWRAPSAAPDPSAAPELIKLHGSTNWLTAYPVVDPETGAPRLSHDLDPSAFNVFFRASQPYDCHAGRYMAGYAPYSYGYYPPNLEFPGMPAPKDHVILSVRPKPPWKPEGATGSGGLVSMPLIIPPVRRKTYDLYGTLFGGLWRRAEDLLAAADEIVVIGYSFPVTDLAADKLFRSAFSRRNTMPRVIVIDPAPDRPADKFRLDLGVREPFLEVRKAFFSRDTVL